MSEQPSGPSDPISFFGGDPLIVGFISVIISLSVLCCLFRCRRFRDGYDYRRHRPRRRRRHPWSLNGENNGEGNGDGVSPDWLPFRSQPAPTSQTDDLRYVHVMSPLRSDRAGQRGPVVRTETSEPLPKYEAPPPGYDDAVGPNHGDNEVDLSTLPTTAAANDGSDQRDDEAATTTIPTAIAAEP